MVTPTDFAAITGLRVGGDPISFDSGIHADPAALEWFLGEVPKIERGAARYAQFKKYLKKKVTIERKAEQMARAYLFGASLFPGRGSTLWAYEVLKMYPSECNHADLSTLPRALIWSKESMGTKEGRGSLNAYRLYLDDLRASQIVWDPWRTSGPEPKYLARSRAVTASRVLLESAFGWQWYVGDRVTRQSLGYLEFQVPGPLSPRASHTGDYTLTELERFTRPDTELPCYLHPEMDYAAYQRDRLARPLGVRARREVQEQAREAAAERRAAAEIQRGGEGHVRCKVSRPIVGGPPELLWKVDVVDSQGNPAEVPVEWVNEAVRRMLALENVVQGRAASKKKARSPPRAQTTTPPAATRHTRSSQSATTSKEAARKAVTCAEERYQIEMRERLSQDEPACKKQLILSQPAEEVEEEEGGEEEARDNSDDTADNPNYLQDSTENLDDDDSGGDNDDDGGDTAWFGRSEGRSEGRLGA
ncbi:hypothetical protein RHMOL_Rhmol04G0185500 [Rhododendron molle]|uniref:Uncharacterized protein n=1 Tax=Rhododendron molle TaxID=49168 RepID=A0ACC0P332_RHOML|nr:hypothetical protein RHMOL_Rhmol04G0185500 [Rhododendron molle]